MDFESPDVEKDFPGLYASESSKKCNESDFSDENHEKSFKKDLIIGKRKEKKDSKKDRGYAALEGESSPDEEDSKSPSKSKKSKSFKFPTKKSEKREKSREKDAKEKEVEKEKKKDKEKKEKEKNKPKEKKKKHGDESTEGDEYLIFTIPLEIAVERSGCLDGVAIPLVVRHCIDCIHQSGLTWDGLYKVTGVKSKVQTYKKAYNLRESVSLADNDVAVATCLLKTYLRELPEPILTNELLARFEEAGAIKEVAAREIELQNLIKQLPNCNKVLLAWLIVHLDTVTMHEKNNKINAQSIAMTFSPVMQMSHRLLTALLCHCKALFPDTIIQRYVPPLPPGSLLPSTPKEILTELQKQEAMLNQMHREMNEGFVSKKKEEELWEVQRIVTQLKRKLRVFQKSQEAIVHQKSIDEDNGSAEEKSSVKIEAVAEVAEAPKAETLEETRKEMKVAVSPIKLEESQKPEVATETESDVKKPLSEIIAKEDKSSEKPKVQNLAEDGDDLRHVQTQATRVQNDSNWSIEDLKLELEHEQLLKLQALLQERIDNERSLIDKLRSDISSYRGYSESPSDDSSTGSTPACLSPDSEARMEQLIEENQALEEKKDDLIKRIFEEREACMKLRVYINIMEITGRKDFLPTVGDSVTST